MSTNTPLDQLSDAALLAELTFTISARCQATARLVTLLAEVEARQLHLKAAYHSLAEYCVNHLRLSESCAHRVIAATRAARRCPSVIGLIAAGRLHLSGLQLLAPYLDHEKYAELVHEAIDKTKAEISQLIRTHFPRGDVPSSIAASAEQPPLIAGCAPVPGTYGASTRPPQQLAPLSAQSCHVQFTANRELGEKLQRARDLMAHSNPSRDLATIVDRALDLLIAQLEKRKFARTEKPRPPREGGTRVQAGRVSNQTRREVSSRDDYQCSFVSEGGRRCTARAGLEYDHIEPKARGGGEDTPNLRLFCRAHNHLHAVETYGEDFIRNKIQLRRRSSAKQYDKPSSIAPTVPIGARRLFEPCAISYQQVRNKLVHALTLQGFPKSSARDAVNSLAIDANADVAALLRQAFALLVS